MDIYLINDYGMIQQIPDFSQGLWASAMQLGNIIFNSNVEMAFQSSVFEDPFGIDIVSKLLWWIMLNPQNSANKTPGNYVYDEIAWP
jgi:hypothetical protein